MLGLCKGEILLISSNLVSGWELEPVLLAAVSGTFWKLTLTLFTDKGHDRKVTGSVIEQLTKGCGGFSITDRF